MTEVRGLVVHIAVGYFEGTISWQKNPDANVSSHFVVGRDGRMAQVVDTGRVAWTQGSGNGHWLSVENEGFPLGHKLHRPGWHQLSAAMIDANARLLARAHQLHGVPLQTTSHPTGRGLGYHSMGAENGYSWGHIHCPGEPIKAQLQAIVDQAHQLINGGGTTVYGTVKKGLADGDAVEFVQGACRDIDPNALPEFGVDRDWGDETSEWVKRLFGGNGDVFGPDQNRAYLRKLAQKHAGKEGEQGPPGEPGEPGKDGRDGRTPTRVRLAQEADVIAYETEDEQK